MRAGAAKPIALIALAWCLTGASAAGPGIAVRVPAATELPWRGLMAAGGSDARGGGMMYPAPNLAGFLVAILAHGLVVEGSRNAERTQQEKAADRVLEPYRPLLAGWTQRALLEAALPQLQQPGARLLAEGSEPAADEWLVEMVPGFAIAQDHGTLVLDGLVRVQRPGETAKTETVVRVLSAPLPTPAVAKAEPPVATASAADAANAAPVTPVAAAASAALTGSAPTTQASVAQQHWSADNAKALKVETAAMLAHAIDAALTQLPRTASTPAAPAEVPFRTHRYLMGDVETMERGQLLARGCDRVLLRTLRGNLLSAAVQPSRDKASACAPGYRLDLGSARPAT